MFNNLFGNNDLFGDESENNQKSILQETYNDREFVSGEAGTKRVSAVFILDCSGSMLTNGKIDKVNEGMKLFVENLNESSLTQRCADIGVVTMGGRNARLERRIESISMWEDIKLEADGMTPMKDALEIAAKEIEDRCSFYEQEDIIYAKPWIILLTDGVPTDSNGYPIRDEEYIKEMKDIRTKTGCLTYTFFIGDPESEEGKLADHVLSEVATINPQDPNKKRLSYCLSEEKDNLKKLFLVLSKSVSIASIDTNKNDDIFGNKDKDYADAGSGFSAFPFPLPL